MSIDELWKNRSDAVIEVDPTRGKVGSGFGQRIKLRFDFDCIADFLVATGRASPDLAVNHVQNVQWHRGETPLHYIIF